MQPKKKFSSLQDTKNILPFFSLFLTACGGSSANINMGTSVISGKVVKGPLQNATVFADYDGDGKRDVDEPFTTTDADGAYSLTTKQAADVVALTTSTTVDTSTGEILTEGLILKAPSGFSVITPTTTLVAAGATEVQVKEALGLPEDLDLKTFNPFSLDIDAQHAVAYEKTAAQVFNTIRTISTAANEAGASLEVSQTTVFETMVAKVHTAASSGEALDLTSTSVVSGIANSTKNSLVAELDTVVLDAQIGNVAKSIANVNTAMNALEDLNSDRTKSILKLASDLTEQVTTAMQAEANGEGNTGIILSEESSLLKSVENLNLAPSDITLDNTSIDENSESLIVAELSVVDANIEDSHIFELSGQDAQLFTINDNNLTLIKAADFEVNSNYTFTITAKDQEGLHHAKEFEITVHNTNDNITFGDVLIIGEPLTSNTLEADVSTLSDADNGSMGFENIEYQWYVDGTKKIGATNKTFEPEDGEAFKEISVIATVTDQTGDSSRVISLSPVYLFKTPTDEQILASKIFLNGEYEELLANSAELFKAAVSESDLETDQWNQVIYDALDSSPTVDSTGISFTDSEGNILKAKYSNFSPNNLDDLNTAISAFSSSNDINDLTIEGGFESIEIIASPNNPDYANQTILSFVYSDAGFTLTNHLAQEGKLNAFHIEGSFSNQIADYILLANNLTSYAEKVSLIDSIDQDLIEELNTILSNVMEPTGFSATTTDGTELLSFRFSDNQLSFSILDHEMTIVDTSPVNAQQIDYATLEDYLYTRDYSLLEDYDLSADVEYTYKDETILSGQFENLSSYFNYIHDSRLYSGEKLYLAQNPDAVYLGSEDGSSLFKFSGQVSNFQEGIENFSRLESLNLPVISINSGVNGSEYYINANNQNSISISGYSQNVQHGEEIVLSVSDGVNQISATGSVYDNFIPLHYDVYDSFWQTSTLDLSTLKEGYLKITASLVDTNEIVISDTININKDTTAPVISVSEVVAGDNIINAKEVSDIDISIGLDSSDYWQSIGYKFETSTGWSSGSLGTSYGTSFDDQLQNNLQNYLHSWGTVDGEITLTFTSSDHSGNESIPVIKTILLDTIAPEIYSPQPKSGATEVISGSDIILEFTEQIQFGDGNVYISSEGNYENLLVSASNTDNYVFTETLITTTDGAVLATIDGNSLIVPTDNLLFTKYTFECSEGFIVDMAGNPFDGLPVGAGYTVEIT